MATHSKPQSRQRSGLAQHAKYAHARSQLFDRAKERIKIRSLLRLLAMVLVSWRVCNNAYEFHSVSLLF